MAKFSLDLDFALQQDLQDPLKNYRQQFFIPRNTEDHEICYFLGNSLGAQPRKAIDFIAEEMEKWRELGAGGHHSPKNPWTSFQSILNTEMAALIGAKSEEVVLMNSLTINLHLMLASFYRPTSKRNKLLINPNIFSSDYYALCSVVKYHGLDPKEVILQIPSNADGIVNMQAISDILKVRGPEIALVLVEGVNYLSGQMFDMRQIAKEAHVQGCVMGCDLAHGIGNCEYDLHDDGIDFAVWCTYKYLNGGPGCVGGCFVHERHHHSFALPRFEGWWGHEMKDRFAMDAQVNPTAGAEGWQISNPPILLMSCLRASLDIFKEAGLAHLRKKSLMLTGYLEFLFKHLEKFGLRQITPQDQHARGCQLSFRMYNEAESFVKVLKAHGFSCDYRPKDIIRFAPVPLYNTFQDVYRLYEFIQNHQKVPGKLIG